MPRLRGIWKLAVFVPSALLLPVTPAFGQLPSAPKWSETGPPTCGGHDTAAASRHTKEGIEHYRRAKSGANASTEFSAALALFNSACAEGNDMALEFRAYALAGQGRWTEAAETLDVFLTTHPLEGLPDEVHTRVTAQREEILRQVASLTVEIKGSDSARISIDHRDFGEAPLRELRLPKGSHDIEVTPKGGAPQRRTADLAQGPHDEVFDFTPKPAAATEPQSEQRQPERSTAGPLLPLAIGTAGGAVVLAGVGFGMLAWMKDRVDAYDATCGVHNAPSTCPDLLSQFELSRNLAVGMFIGAGLAAGASATLFVLHFTTPQSRPSRLKQWFEAMWCSPHAEHAAVGLSCGGGW